jgi:hypothetical protein
VTRSRIPAAVLAALLVLALARAGLAFVPSMWAWGLNVQRFLAPLPAWLPWSLTLLALHPAIGEWLTGKLARVGDWLLVAVRGEWAAALTAAAMVWMLPDRTWITGDFLLRQVWAESGGLGGAFGQSLPLELLIDGAIPRLFGFLTSLDPNLATRGIGAVAAGALAVVALRLVREWGLHGAAAATGAGIILFGGYLTAFTGLGKPAAVMGVLVVVVLLGCTRLASSGRGGAPLGIALALALWTHRGALLLLPMWVVSLVMARRGSGPDRKLPRGYGLAVALPALAAIAVAPLVWRIAQSLDIPRHLAPPPVQSVGILASAFEARHLVDLANLLVFFTPLVTLLPVLGLRRAPGEGHRVVLLWILAAPFVPLLLFVHPMQGIIRDLEAFAIAGVSVAMLVAYAVGMALERRALPGWMAPALLLAALVPCLQWLVHFHDSRRGLERVRALALETPRRSDVERARLWDGIAYRAFRLRQWDRAVEASAQSVRYAPHPRSLMMWAIARTYAGDHLGAESLYVAMAERMPEDPLVWVGLGGAALRLRDSVQISRSLDRLHSYAPDGREARIVRRHLLYFPEVWPEPRGRPVTPP